MCPEIHLFSPKGHGHHRLRSCSHVFFPTTLPLLRGSFSDSDRRLSDLKRAWRSPTNRCRCQWASSFGCWGCRRQGTGCRHVGPFGTWSKCSSDYRLSLFQSCLPFSAATATLLGGPSFPISATDQQPALQQGFGQLQEALATAQIKSFRNPSRICVGRGSFIFPHLHFFRGSPSPSFRSGPELARRAWPRRRWREGRRWRENRKLEKTREGPTSEGILHTWGVAPPMWSNPESTWRECDFRGVRKQPTWCGCGRVPAIGWGIWLSGPGRWDLGLGMGPVPNFLDGVRSQEGEVEAQQNMCRGSCSGFSLQSRLVCIWFFWCVRGNMFHCSLLRGLCVLFQPLTETADWQVMAMRIGKVTWLLSCMGLWQREFSKWTCCHAHTHMAMGQSPNRTPSEHSNPH